MKPLHLKLIAAAAFVLLAFAAWWALSHMKAEGPRRQVAKISILPDTPPPPPPPKQEKKPEPPKDEPKQVMREEQAKPVEAPKPAEAIKMEGAAGDGPSAFSSGSVSRDYAGGTPVTGAGGPAGTVTDRAQERFYANTARQLLQGEIERHLKADADQLTATFAIWLDKDGAIQRFELSASGNDGNDAALRAALDETRRQFKLPPPPALALSQPMRFRLSVRPQA
ncbi:TonB C-terminal domain-containing protein [Pelomonas sp. P7]|uniref:TonB C-terminal domain-containing protein n=1 Tax=Pelomonas caseinilytica TaxID=2906763 RepID=A0ABS8XGV8_9BURK|nr:TonB C-terminal domain-containing protein [Pelomonas sp. P7]MCE4538066.1 TonB C-terminal domain-containing protein [Pelomonas sp. P7]